MPFLTHITVIAVYAAIAAVVAMMLPQSLPDLDPTIAYLVGICIFLAAALMHEIMVRRYESRDIAEEMAEVRHLQIDESDSLRQNNARLLDDLAAAREELNQLRAHVETAAGERSEKLVSEVKVLQQLLHQFAARNGRTDDSFDDSSLSGLDSSAFPAQFRSEPPLLSRPMDDDTTMEIVHQALEGGRIDLYLQPIVSLPQRKTRFYEAFSRIRSGDGELLLPDRYLRLAAERGLLPVIDNLLLFRCVQLVRRVKRRKLEVGFFVNISAASLADGDFIGQFVEFMAANPELSERLVFEVSQQDVSRHWDAVAADLDRLGQLGFRFSLDQVTHLDLDVEQLVRWHFKFIKISPELLLSDGAAAGARIHPMDLREMLKRSRIDLIAEKVETEAQVLELLEFGVDFGQGYLFREPRPSREG